MASSWPVKRRLLEHLTVNASNGSRAIRYVTLQPVRYSELARSIVFVLVVGSACGPVVDDDTGGDTSNASEGAETTHGTATAGTTETPVTATDAIEGSSSNTGGPVDCDSLALEECDFSAGCETAEGPEATPEGGPGEYYCSDLKVEFACVSPDCEPVPGIFILCKIDEPGVAVWVIDQCLPAGWEPCPDAVCA